jgi:hypothetical protein
MTDSRAKTRTGRTIDTCSTCGGGIANRPIHAPNDDSRWVHIYEHDWVNNPHQAIPNGGPVKEEE